MTDIVNSIADLLDRKGRTVHSTEPSKSLVECADRMIQANVGSLVVVDEQNVLQGVVTYRDVLRAIAEDRQPREAKVADVMMKDVTAVGEGTSLKDAEAKMVAAGIRHLPVTHDGKVVGIVTRIDVLKLHLQQLDQFGDDLVAYIGGAYP